jgi:outer membrane receptor protein involved in Fe transport
MYVDRSAAVFLALGAALVGACFTQSTLASAETAPEDKVLAEVVITGSRLATTTGFDTPTPVTTLEAEALTAAVPNNMGEALSQLPSLAGSIQNTTSGQGSANSQTNGQNLLDLRNLGPERTLILLDGQRMGVTNVVGSVDINIIPQSLVKRVDVVTGGASASYGSDAVAGVVNFILDTQFEGLKVDANYGQTTYNDAENGKVSVAFGKQLSDRARVIGGVEYFRLNGLKWGEDTGRDWHTHPTMSVANAAGAQPRWLLIPDARARFGSFGGTITAVQTPNAANTAFPNCTAAACTALVNNEFLPGGATAPLAQATNVFGNNAYVSGGGGSIANQAFAPKKAERKGLFLHGEFDVNDNVTLWGQGSYNASDTFNQAQVLQTQTNNQFRIYEDNAYLPAALRASLGSVAGTQSFNLTRYSRDMGFNEVTGNVEVSRFAAGVKGSINDRWSYDTILGYQDTHQDLDVRTAIMRNLYAAAEAVVHPVTGQIVCRSQWYNTAGVFVPGGTGMDPGCVPMNLFGDGAVSQAATDYVMGLNTADIDLRQSTFDANLRGDFGDGISLGAGPISFATGMNYRRLTALRKVDPLSAIYKDGTGIRGFPNISGTYGGYSYYNPSPVSGRVTVTEGYVEFGVPLLRDVPAIQALSATLAGRMTDYSQSGVKDMWKLGLNWTVNDSVRVRGTVSADTRAPSVIELFNTAQVSRGTYTLPASNAPVTFTGAGQNIAIGNPNLEPEDAKTYTAGIVFSPAFLPEFQASVDWYKIELLGSIAAPDSQDILNRCYAGDQAYCAMFTVNGQPATTTTGIGPNDFVAVTNALMNQADDTYTAGIDFETSYRTALGAGDLDLRLTGNYLLDQHGPDIGCAAGARGRTEDLVGAIGSSCGIYPKIRARVSAKYDIGRFGFYIQERYIHKGMRNPNFVTGVDISDNSVPAVSYTDMTLTVGLGAWLDADGEIYFNVTNLFDKDPPPTNSTAGRSWIDPTEEEIYDLLGRRYLLGARFKW